MSRQAGGKPRAKPPPQSYSGYEPELYEEMEIQEEKVSVDTKRGYPERSHKQSQQQPHQQPHQQPAPQQPAPSVAEAKEPTKPMNKVYLILIAVIAIFLFCVVVLCVLAVILYRPQSSGDLLLKIERLEREVKIARNTQSTNSTSQLFNLVYSQLKNVQGLANYSLSLLNLHKDLDRLGSVDFYESCIQETRSCTIFSGGNYYLKSCVTSPSLHISPNVTQHYTLDKSCEFGMTDGYFESVILYKNGNEYFCRCDATIPSIGYHVHLPTSYATTCTLTVTMCPYSMNLLS